MFRQAIFRAMIGKRLVTERQARQTQQAAEASSAPFLMTFGGAGGPAPSAPPPDAAPPETPPPEESKPSGFGEALISMVPAEVIAVFAVLNGLGLGPVASLAFAAVGLVATSVITWLPYRHQEGDRAGVAAHVVLATIAFALWSLTVGSPFGELVGLERDPDRTVQSWQPALSATILVFSGLIAPTVFVLVGRDRSGRPTGDPTGG